PVGDRRPDKMILDTLAAVASEALAQRRVERYLVDRHGQVVREPRRVDRVEYALFQLQVDQQASLTGHYHLGDAADRRSHPGGLTRHRLQVDDPEWLVDRRAAE